MLRPDDAEALSAGRKRHHPDRLFAITKDGVAKAAKLAHHESAMPAFGGVLSDEEIRAVLLLDQGPVARRDPGAP